MMLPFILTAVTFIVNVESTYEVDTFQGEQLTNDITIVRNTKDKSKESVVKFDYENCPSGESSLLVVFKPDKKSEKENMYEIFKKTSPAEWKLINTVDSFESDKLHISQMCLKDDTCYTFQMNDSGRNGLCCGHGEGYYNIIYNGVEVEHSTLNKPTERTIFGDCKCNEKIYTFDRYTAQKCPEICGDNATLFNGWCMEDFTARHRADRWKWVSCAPKESFPSSFTFFSEIVKRKDLVCYSYTREEGALIQFVINNFESHKFRTKNKGYVMRGPYKKIAGPESQSTTNSQFALEQSCHLAYTYSGLDFDSLLSHWEDCTKARHSLTGKNGDNVVTPIEARFGHVRDGMLIPDNSGLLFTDNKNVRFLDFSKNEIRNLLLVKPEFTLNTVGFGSENFNFDKSKFILGGEIGLSRILDSKEFNFMKIQQIKQVSVSPNGCYAITCSVTRGKGPLLFDLCQNATKPKEIKFNNPSTRFEKCYGVTFVSNKEAIVVDQFLGKQILHWGVLNIKTRYLDVTERNENTVGCIPDRFEGYLDGESYPSRETHPSYGVHGISNVIHAFNRAYVFLALTYDDGFCMCELKSSFHPKQCEYIYPNLEIK